MDQDITYQNKIDDYEQTIHAIVGFMNFYLYDPTTESMKEDVSVFQGRRLLPSPEKSTTSKGEVPYVTPDFGILLPTKFGVLGEVKKSFPQEQEYWRRTFEQLLKYDDDLSGWPLVDKVNSHDIVLILHQTRATAVRNYYEQSLKSIITFQRSFSMVQFIRAEERAPYYLFQKIYGTLTDKTIDEGLTNSIPVPMAIFVKTYSQIKIYDSKPPLPYLMDLIWTNIVLPIASDKPEFNKIRKNQKIEVELTIDKIAEELHAGFSFHCFHEEHEERQPHIPQREWVMEACEQLVKSEDANWADEGKNTIRILFKKKYDDTLAHFIECCAGKEEDENQLNIF